MGDSTSSSHRRNETAQGAEGTVPLKRVEWYMGEALLLRETPCPDGRGRAIP